MAQTSFDTRLNRFVNGNTLIQSWADYKPDNALIKKQSITDFITAVEKANSTEEITKDALDKARSARTPLCFIIKDSNPDCMERRMQRVHAYLSGELTSAHPTARAIRTLLKKIRPVYKGATGKKTFTLGAGEILQINKIVDGSMALNTGTRPLALWDGTGPVPGNPVEIDKGNSWKVIAPSGTLSVKNLSNESGAKIQVVVITGKEVEKSPSERTLAALISYSEDMLTRLSELASEPSPSPAPSAAAEPVFSYDPPDEKISVASLGELLKEIKKITSDIALALDKYGIANRNRKTLYDGKDGMETRIRQIKSYLASFTGGKKSEHFIEFSQAIKGT